LYPVGADVTRLEILCKEATAESCFRPGLNGSAGFVLFPAIFATLGYPLQRHVSQSRMFRNDYVRRSVHSAVSVMIPENHATPRLTNTSSAGATTTAIVTPCGPDANS